MRRLIILILTVAQFNCINKVNLNYHSDIISGLKESKNTGKPIFLLFNGYFSIGYDSFKNRIITNRNVVHTLNKNFVNIILYCDDPRMMTNADTLSFSELGFDNLLMPYQSKIKSFGNLNAFLEIAMYDINTQPLYVIMDSNLNLLIDPFGAVSNPDQFYSKLEPTLQKLK
ncbi:MAG: hypothetical protein IPL98_06720 [Saprospiraceae bacterium]|nr:hypothetical protein [Saprospiraceae bacterium]